MVTEAVIVGDRQTDGGQLPLSGPKLEVLSMQHSEGRGVQVQETDSPRPLSRHIVVLLLVQIHIVLH